MSRRRVALYGAGHLGRQLCHHLVSHAADTLELLGFVDDTRPAGEPVVAGLPTLGSLEDAARSEVLGPGRLQLVFAIGYGQMAQRRRALDRVQALGYELHSWVHPRAWVEPGVQLGAGSVVLAHAVLDQAVVTGPGCYIDIGVRLTADTRVGANNFIASGSSTGSRVCIGDNCFIGMDCTLTTDVRVGNDVFINAKSLITRDVPDGVKWVEVRRAREWPAPPGV